MSLADEFAAIAKAAFIAGALSETKKIATKSGRKLVSGTADKAVDVARKVRKPSKYNLEYKKQYAKLKKKHPRSSFSALAKKAHKATKKVMN